jgi:pSer/pThr/pTyr-binding forkhead associated (FHA) protein
VIKLTLYFKGNILKVFQPKSDLIRIGSAEDCDIAIDNLAILPLHAEIKVDGETAVLKSFYKKDDSDKQTFPLLIDNKPVEEHSMEHNDEIHLGKYSIKFTREIDQPKAPPAETRFITKSIIQGWLQFMSGPKLGRTVKIENGMIRLGKSGKPTAMISTRDGQFYISHLEGEPKTRVRGSEIGADRICLNDGDTLEVGETKMLFFVDK